MRFSIVIPTYNRKDLLRRCLAATTNQDYPDYEVIVVDDGSTDGTGGMAQREFPQVRYLRQETNRGPAATRNWGIREATGEIIAFTDDDCVPTRDWLSDHLRYYDDLSVGAVGGSQIPRNPNFYDKFEMAHYADEYLGGLQRIEKISSWEGLATNNMSVRREIFQEVGFFDEKFLTGADPEFARRVSQAGYILIRDPGIRVDHLKVDTLRFYFKMRFSRGCGSVLTDIKEGSLCMRRFLPLVNVVKAGQDWRNFRKMFGGGLGTFLRFWGLVVIARWVDVAGRAYYYWTAGRFYHLSES